METEKAAGVANEPAEGTETGGLDPKGVLAFAAALLVPGAGHALSGRWGRAVLVGGVLLIAFGLGLWLDGRLNVFDRENYLSLLFVFGNAGSGLLYVLCLVMGVGLEQNAQAPTYEYGTHLLLIVGLLNYLAALDAYDLAVGRKD